MSLLTGLVSYYPLDGNVLDAHGANPGTATAITYGTGHTSQAAFGNGTTSYINLGTANLNITGDLTISAWVKVTAANCTGFIATRCLANGGTDNTYEFRLASGTPQFLIYSGQPIASSSLGAIPLDVWVFLVAVRSGTTQMLYVDGTLAASVTLTLAPTSLPAAPTFIGTRADGNAFLGAQGFAVDEVAFYNRALSYDEVRDLWSTPGGYPLTPVPFTPFFTHEHFSAPTEFFELPFEDIFAVDQLAPTAGFCSELDFPSRGSVTEGFFAIAGASPATGGGSPPVVTNLTPTAMTTVARYQQHEFDFTDNGPFRTIVVAAKYPSGRWDLIYDGDDFNSDYASSSITPIVGGFHLSIARDAGWLELGALKLMVKGIDQTGEENT